MQEQRARGVPASRAPIVIAVEESEAPLVESELLQIERHLTVSLGPREVAALEDVAAGLKDAISMQEMIHHGMDAWEVLESAQPRLSLLMETVRSEFTRTALPQPI